MLLQSCETGYRCVSKHGGGFEARITENGKTRHLGTFRTVIEAALCYAIDAIEEHSWKA